MFVILTAGGHYGIGPTVAAARDQARKAGAGLNVFCVVKRMPPGVTEARVDEYGCVYWNGPREGVPENIFKGRLRAAPIAKEEDHGTSR